MRWFPRLVSSLAVASPWKQQIRTTFILKRRHEVPLEKVVDGTPRKLRVRHRIYDFVEFTENTGQHKNISVILMNYVKGVGLKGEEVSVKKHFARNKLLLPGLAVYATEENKMKYKLDPEALRASEKQYSSKTAPLTMQFLSKSIVLLTMNLEQPWTIEPWHVKVAFRKARIMVPEHAITLPSKPISGPNLELEGKCFLVTVTINGTEKVVVRCRIHHWHSNVAKRPPRVEGYWEAPLEPIFLEDAETLLSLPTPASPIRPEL